MTGMTVEKLAANFVALASRPSISKAELAEAEKLMQQLKELGMSNEEISKLSGGKWSPSTVKGYTKGVKPPHPNPWQDAVGLLNHIINRGLTLEDMRSAATVSESLESSGVTLEDMTDLLQAARSASISIKEAIDQYKALDASGISPEDIREALNLKHELEAQGLGLSSLRTLAQLAKKYGEPQKVIEAMSEYASIGELKKQTSAAQVDLKTLNQQRERAQQQLEHVQAEVKQLREPLEAYEKAKKLGFGETELLRLHNLVKKQGTVKNVLSAVEAYSSYREILEEVNKEKNRLDSIRAEIKKTEAEYSHLRSAITMCQELMQQHKFGLDAITTIFSLAQKFGDPLTVLKAVEAYGKLQVLLQELSKAEGRLAERKQFVAQWEGRYREVMDQFELVNARALKVGKEVGKVQMAVEQNKWVSKIMALVTNPTMAPYDEFAPVAAPVALALQKWTSTHSNRIQNSYSVTSGLDALIRNLVAK